MDHFAGFVSHYSVVAVGCVLCILEIISLADESKVNVLCENCITTLLLWFLRVNLPQGNLVVHLIIVLFCDKGR